MHLMTPSQAMQFLTGFDHASDPHAAEYLNTHVHRLLRTLNSMPKLRPGARILELGAAPYVMTALLLRSFPDCHLELANAPDGLDPEDRKATLVHRKLGLHYSLEYKAFNIETDRFPYEDGTFDLILYCEIIEHLLHDPSHSLYEIHRVLKPEGHLVLTTPNPLRYSNYLKLLAGKNIYPPFAGHDLYVRHTREFSIDELRHLLTLSNFQVQTLITAYDPAYHIPIRIDRLAHWFYRHGFLRDKMDVIHLQAKTFGEAVYRYPPELYDLVHKYQRVLSGSIEMGTNDDAQLGVGFHDLECWPPFIRWTDKLVAVKLLGNSSTTCGIRFFSGPAILGRDVTGSVLVNGIPNRLCVKAGEWTELQFPISPADNGVTEVELRLDEVWVPQEIGMGPDTRALGIAIQRIWTE